MQITCGMDFSPSMTGQSPSYAWGLPCRYFFAGPAFGSGAGLPESASK